MTNTLEDLQSGKLLGVKRLKLACGLTTFPNEIFDLSDSLEILDLSDNNFSSLPERMGELKKLKIVFFANNNFTEFPKVLAKCESLTMIGFKANAIETVPENAFPPLLQWLILTDNKITSIPKSIGDCGLLQKFLIAGNQIKELPLEMANCTSLELLRISANKLNQIPKWLFELPKLSWVAFSGNPATFKNQNVHDLQYFDWNEFEIENLLGEGASGLIYKAKWQNKDVAVKVFKGAVTSDGLPEDEMNLSIQAGNHDSLTQVLGAIKNHTEGKNGLVLKLIPLDFSNLGNPPSFETCTRDVFDEHTLYTEPELYKIVKSVVSVGTQLHENGINHGGLYAHNILINDIKDTLLSDFGAGSFYDKASPIAELIEKVEVRALGCLVEDVFLKTEDLTEERILFWKGIIEDCFNPTVSSRPTFKELNSQLES